MPAVPCQRGYGYKTCILPIIPDRVFLPWRNHLIVIMTLFYALLLPPWHLPVAIVPYYTCKQSQGNFQFSSYGGIAMRPRPPFWEIIT